MADSNEFSCDFCKKTFSTKGNLKKHYLKFHGGVPQSFHSLKTEKLQAKPCPKCGSLYKLLPKHIAICKAGDQSQKDRVAVKTTFISSTRGQKNEELGNVESEEEMTDSDVIPRSPSKKRIDEFFDLTADFSKWMSSNGISLKARQAYLGPLSKALGKININRAVNVLPNLPNQIKELQTVNARRKLFLAHIKLADFLRLQIGLDIEAFQPPSINKYIALYLESDARKELYHNFTNITKAMEMGWSPDLIHDFLMGEVILSNRSGRGFVNNCSLAEFLAVERPDAQGKWHYKGPNYNVQFPDFLRQMLKSFAFIVRPRLLKGRKSHEVKLFEVYARAGIPCPLTGSLFQYVENFSRSLEQITMEKVSKADFYFTFFKWSDFEGEIKGYKCLQSEKNVDESEEEEVDFNESNAEAVPVEIDHSLMEPQTVNVETNRSVDVLQKPSSSKEKPKRSLTSLTFTEKEINFLKGFFQKYKASEINERTVMIVLQFADDVDDLIEQKMSEVGMTDKQFWQVTASILKENM